MQSLNSEQQILIADNLEVARRQARRWSRKFDRISFDDYFQNAALFMCQALRSYDEQKYPDLPKYLGSAAKRGCLRLLQNREREQAGQIPEVEIEGASEQVGILLDVREAVARLPVREREVMNRRLTGISDREIAGEFGISRQAVLNNRGRGLNLLRNFLRSYA